MFELLLTLHLLAAVTWVGGSIALSILVTRFAEAERGLVAPHFSWYGSTVLTGAAFVLLLAGIGLVIDVDGYEFSDPWVIVGIAGWLISAILGGGLLGPLGKKLQEATDDAQRTALIDRIITVSRIDTVVIVLVVIDMAVKPGG